MKDQNRSRREMNLPLDCLSTNVSFKPLIWHITNPNKYHYLRTYPPFLWVFLGFENLKIYIFIIVVLKEVFKIIQWYLHLTHTNSSSTPSHHQVCVTWVNSYHMSNLVSLNREKRYRLSNSYCLIDTNSRGVRTNMTSLLFTHLVDDWASLAIRFSSQ